MYFDVTLTFDGETVALPCVHEGSIKTLFDLYAKKQSDPVAYLNGSLPDLTWMVPVSPFEERIFILTHLKGFSVSNEAPV